MAETINVQKSWGEGTIDVTREEFYEKFKSRHQLWLLKDYKDLEGTEKMYAEIEYKIKALCNYKFNLIYSDESRR